MNKLKTLKLIVTCVFVWNISACAMPATHEAMIPQLHEITKQNNASIEVIIDGGRDTNPLWRTQISNDVYRLALIESISKSNLFSDTTKGSKSDYQLFVNLLSLEYDGSGLDIIVTLETGWNLKRASTDKIIWRGDIISRHTATFSDAFVGITRMRLAVEGAAKTNIKDGLLRVSKLDL